MPSRVRSMRDLSRYTIVRDPATLRAVSLRAQYATAQGAG